MNPPDFACSRPACTLEATVTILGSFQTYSMHVPAKTYTQTRVCNNYPGNGF